MKLRELRDLGEVELQHRATELTDELFHLRLRRASSQLPNPMKVREILLRLRKDGWTVIRQRGSHKQLKHLVKRGRVTVPGRDSDDLAPGTVNSILKQAGLRKRD